MTGRYDELMPAWHSRSLDGVFVALSSTREGLKTEDAKERLKRYGANILPGERPYSKTTLFLDQFRNPLAAILLIAAAISLYLANYSDAVFILIVLFINAGVGFYQENKADDSLRALKRMVRIPARVIRDGVRREIDSTELTVGDIIELRPGDKVPADARLFAASGLRVDEASLTGEWIPVVKAAGDLAADVVLAERTNMVFMGTGVEDGSGTAVVVAVGAKSAIGDIVTLLRDTKGRRTPLQQKIASLSRLVGAFIIATVALVALLGYFGDKPFAEIFIASLALAVSATPAGLLPAVTVILVLGMRRILAERGLVRKLIANETLGSVTVICTDKTGTLTQAKMQVSRIVTGSGELLADGNGTFARLTLRKEMRSHALALRAAVLASDAFIENPDDALHDLVVRGRPTERALVIAGAQAGFDKAVLEHAEPPIERLSFSSDRAYAASLHEARNGRHTLYVVGAPESIARHSTLLSVNAGKRRLNSSAYRALRAKEETFTKDGLRVVACAYRTLPSGRSAERPLTELVEKLTFIGYIVLRDPLREDAAASIAVTKRAGIKTVLVTGDHAQTAASIAREVGIDAPPGSLMEGRELEGLSQEELTRRIKSISIFARVAPQHKLRIVEAFQARGEVVAMLGDGVNDAPALKAADVGVVVGSGTDVAKEVADIVLLDDSFSTIVKAIEQGRVVFGNIRKVFVYLVADDFSELFLFLAAMLFGLPLPLLAAQILWINVVEDGFPGIALTTEQERSGVMDEKPRSIREPIISRPIKYWLGSILVITGLAAFTSFVAFWQWTGSVELARTMTFALMGIDSLIFAFSVRSFHRPIWRRDIFSNRLLVWAALAGVGLLLLAVYLPLLQPVLSTQPLGMLHWFAIISVSIIEIILLELAKRKIFGTRTTRTGTGSSVRPLETVPALQ